MPGHLILLLALVSADETCLLQLKSQERVEAPVAANATRLMLTATGETITIHAAIEMQRAWQKRHSALKAEFGRYVQHARQDPQPKYMDVGGVAVDPSTFGKVASDTIKNEPDGIMDFIKRSIASEQTCNAKMVEVRRTLDGILAKVNQLS